MVTMNLRKLIQYGIEAGLVLIVDSPNEDGAVCKIGDYWFYFGGQTAEEMTAAEYIRDIPRDTIIDEVTAVLKEFSQDLDGFGTEYLYYQSYLLENLLGKFRAKKAGCNDYVIGYYAVDSDGSPVIFSKLYLENGTLKNNGSIHDAVQVDPASLEAILNDTFKDVSIEIHVNVEDGLVTDVYSNLPSDKVAVYVMDHDTQDPDDAEIEDDALNGCIERVRAGSLFCVY